MKRIDFNVFHIRNNENMLCIAALHILVFFILAHS